LIGWRWKLFLFFVAVALLTNWLAARQSPAPRPSVQALSAKPDESGHPAFLGARWGSTPAQVRAKIGRDFVTPRTDLVFSRIIDPLKNADTTVFELPSAPYAGREAAVWFVFIGDRLGAYYIFLEDADPAALDTDARVAVEAEFGDATTAVEDKTPLKAVWSQGPIDVNYWILRDEFRLTPRFRAAVGVRSKKITG